MEREGLCSGQGAAAAEAGGHAVLRQAADGRGREHAHEGQNILQISYLFIISLYCTLAITIR